MKLVVLGLTLSSSWGNGHATTYRSLLKYFARRGHSIVFLEQRTPWYADHRDLWDPSYASLAFYRDEDDLKRRYARMVAEADGVMVGSHLLEGIAIGKWVESVAEGVTLFYDMDPAETVAGLQTDTCPYLSADLVPAYSRYLTLCGGPLLRTLERLYGARSVRPLYAGVDPEMYFPESYEHRWAAGLLGTFAHDRMKGIEELLVEPARRLSSQQFLVAGAHYPGNLAWPGNIQQIDHLRPYHHRGFFNRQKYTLNLTREGARRGFHAPSLRVLEAAACGVPAISDSWPGLADFFHPGWEILVARSGEVVCEILQDLPEEQRLRIGVNARERVLAQHTAAQRAEELERAITGAIGQPQKQTARPATRPAARPAFAGLVAV